MDPARPSRPSGGSIWATPFLWINWICEWAAYIASNVALFQILEYAGKLGILIAVITWFADYDKRRQADIRAAWSVVNIKGGGRKEALEYLARQNDVDLRGLYGRGGYFSDINLEGRNLSGSDLEDADFDGARLNGATLQGSNLSGASFKGAYLEGARFQNSHFSSAPSFEGAHLKGADFTKMAVRDFPGDYLVFTEALDWKAASFVPGVMPFLECVVAGSNTESSSKLASACGSKVPELIQGGDSLPVVNDLIENAACEVRNAVYSLYKDYAGQILRIDSWGVQTTLAVLTDEHGAFADLATRGERVSQYNLIADLRKYQCTWRPNMEGLLRSDLKLKEWLYDVIGTRITKVAALPPNTSGPNVGKEGDGPDVGQEGNAFQHEVKFVVVLDRTPGSISRVMTPSDDSSGSAGRRQTYDLLVTFGPVDNSAKTGNSANPTRARPSSQAADLHLAALISIGIESAMQKAPEH